ncbi:MAG: hypothetical protein O2894_13140 [Planctomycetota bacterium]|nr:hypothetical protein [Planctomycetota bacterium]
MNGSTLLAVLALATAVGAGGMLYSENAALKKRLDAIETDSGLVAGPAIDGEAPAGPGLQGASVRRDVAELQGVADALMRRMEAIEERPVAATSAGSGDAPALADGPAFGEAVRAVVLDMATNDIDFRARVGAQGRNKIAKNSPFAKVASVLELDASQESQMSKDLQGMQGELFQLLGEPRDDGVVPYELIAEAEGLKEGDPRRAEVFIKLFTMKIPGKEETYMQRAVSLTQTFRKRVDTYLRPQQLELLNGVEIDWFSIKFD